MMEEMFDMEFVVDIGSMRRITLLKTEASATSGIFPIVLVTGENGEYGIEIYNYFQTNYPPTNYTGTVVTFASNEVVTVDGIRIDSFHVMEDAVRIPHPSGNLYYLHSDGTIIVVEI